MYVFSTAPSDGTPARLDLSPIRTLDIEGRSWESGRDRERLCAELFAEGYIVLGFRRLDGKGIYRIIATRYR